MIRRDGAWVEIDWKTAYQEVTANLAKYGQRAGFLAGPSLANEDYWELRKLARLTHRDCQLGLWPPTMTGLENITQVGVGVGTRLPDMGSDSAILVIASDLEEEAPIWWLQVKQAADRGAQVVVANGRTTKLDQYAAAVVHYDYGEAVAVLHHFAAIARRQDKIADDVIAARVDGYADFEAELKKARVPQDQAGAAETLLKAENLIVFVGGEGLTLAQHRELMQAASNLLIITGHVARPNNGLVAVWPGANYQGALDLGFSPEATVSLLDQPPALWFIAEADPVAEDAHAAAVIRGAEFVVALAQFMTPTAEQADLVLPIQSFAEREGTFTTGMRRVQRFYMAQTPLDGPLPAWKLLAHIGAGMKGGDRPRISAALVMRDITQHVLRYGEMDYTHLAHVEPQFPDVGGHDLYYGGAAYSNRGGLGVQWATNAEKEKYRLAVRPVDKTISKPGGLMVVPIRLLYNRERLFAASAVMHPRVPAPYAELSRADAGKLGIADGDRIEVTVGDLKIHAQARVNGRAPAGIVLLPVQLSQSPTPLAPVKCAVQKIKG
jgi:NADH-quinone oxidoreductase subunit G